MRIVFNAVINAQHASHNLIPVYLVLGASELVIKLITHAFVKLDILIMEVLIVFNVPTNVLHVNFHLHNASHARD